MQTRAITVAVGDAAGQNVSNVLSQTTLTSFSTTARCFHSNVWLWIIYIISQRVNQTDGVSAHCYSTLCVSRATLGYVKVALRYNFSWWGDCYLWSICIFVLCWNVKSVSFILWYTPWWNGWVRDGEMQRSDQLAVRWQIACFILIKWNEIHLWCS